MLLMSLNASNSQTSSGNTPTGHSSSEKTMKAINNEQTVALSQMKELLDQTINVKIKYENIIKKLVSEPESRDRTL